MAATLATTSVPNTSSPDSVLVPSAFGLVVAIPKKEPSFGYQPTKPIAKKRPPLPARIRLSLAPPCDYADWRGPRLPANPVFPRAPRRVGA